MITVTEALEIVLENAGSPSTEEIPIREAAGRVLAEDVKSDIDMPPFDRSAMDGFAVAGEGREHLLMGEITAGNLPRITVTPGRACAIMTGAPVPRGADRVIMVEHATVEGDRLHIGKIPPEGANICFRGEDVKTGQTVLPRKTGLSGNRIGIAAMAGKNTLSVFSKSVVGLITTGNEIIPSHRVPAPGEVRNTNLPMMEAVLRLNGFTDTRSTHCEDDPSSLEETLGTMLETCDVILTAGGVSMGTRDHVPGVLRSLGVELLFREVAQKPGKPLTFGVGHDDRVIFGLPGNPVSVMVSLEEYVLPLLRKRSGFREYTKRDFTGNLLSGFRKKPGRLGYIRAVANFGNSGCTIELPPSSGSGDLMSTFRVNALVLAPGESTGAEAGESARFHLMSAFAGEMAFI